MPTANGRVWLGRIVTVFVIAKILGRRKKHLLDRVRKASDVPKNTRTR